MDTLNSFETSIQSQASPVRDSSSNPTPLTIIPELITEDIGGVVISLSPVTVPISLISLAPSYNPSYTTNPGKFTTEKAIPSLNPNIVPVSNPTSQPISNPKSYLAPKLTSHSISVHSSPSTSYTLGSSVSENHTPSTVARNPAPYHATESSYFGGLSQFDTRINHNAPPYPEFRVPVNYYAKSTQSEPDRLNRNGYFQVPDFKIPTVPQSVERPPSSHTQFNNQSILNGPPPYQSKVNLGPSQYQQNLNPGPTPHQLNQNVGPPKHQFQNNFNGRGYADTTFRHNINMGPRQPYDRARTGYIPHPISHPVPNRPLNQTLPKPLEASLVRNTRQKIPIALPPIQIPHSFVPIPLPRRMNTYADLVRSRELHHNKYKGRFRNDV